MERAREIAGGLENGREPGVSGPDSSSLQAPCPQNSTRHQNDRRNQPSLAEAKCSMQTCVCCPEAILSLTYKSGYRCSCFAVHKLGSCHHLTIISRTVGGKTKEEYFSELLLFYFHFSLILSSSLSLPSFFFCIPFQLFLLSLPYSFTLLLFPTQPCHPSPLSSLYIRLDPVLVFFQVSSIFLESSPLLTALYL